MNFYDFTKLEFEALYRNRSLLLIEKDGSIRKKLDVAFKSKCFKVAACAQIDAGKKWLKEGTIDVVVMDFDEHLMEKGLDAIKTKLTPLDNYPIIAICEDEEEGRLLEEAGVYSYLLRPINFNRLVAKVEELYE